ncbi:hypothetical protein FJT64_012242 [Amphibalanus amphitrite]|uniref:Uncharacterized protein n=1 Tax=Amphibalanus amphitrite TaxID=1232801 RepID=A0A6A4VJC8_AMPAM|nr:hypothetical protein FJT64_012242 [Amphibalanus amphitrite]
MPVVQFAPVPGSVPEIPETVFKELSSDQQIVHRLAMGVQSGTIAPQDASRRIGPLNHASELRDIVRFIVQHYLPMWFCIRQTSSCIDGPKNFMRSLELLRKLPQELQNIVQPVTQRNAYWAHPEAVLLSMVADGNPDLRARAVHAIKKCRMQPTDEVRPYILPQINFQAATYAEVFDWDKTKMTEPPLTIGLCDSVIQDIFHTPLKVKNYPVHTQAVERAVQVVTEASYKVAGEAQRHGNICNKLKHRKQNPCVASKRSFVEAFTASQ